MLIPLPGLRLWPSLLWSLLLASCQSGPGAVGPTQQELASSCAQILQSSQNFLGGDAQGQLGSEVRRSWKDVRPLSIVEIAAIQELKLVDTNAPQKPGYRSYQIPERQQVQQELLSGNFRTILPLQTVDGWNLFVLAERFAASSDFIRSFVLLIEGRNGWQSHYLYSAVGGNYEGGYDIGLSSIDLNYNGRQELLFTTDTGTYIRAEVLELTQQPLQLELRSIEAPGLHSYQAEFQDNYLVRVQLQEQNKPLLVRRFPLARREPLGYSATGHWTGGTIRPQLSPQPLRLQAKTWSCGKQVYNLLYTRQPLLGLAKGDIIGYFDTFWMLQGQRADLLLTGLSGSATARLAKPPGKAAQQPAPTVNWALLRNSFTPAPGNELLQYEALLPS